MDLDIVPSWAYSWCFFFFFMGIISIVSGITSVFSIKRLGMGLMILYLIAAVGQAATAFTLYYMCRRSLGGPVQKEYYYASQFSHN